MDETLKKIVEQSALSEEMRAVFGEIFSALAERDAAIMSEIRARVFAEATEIDAPWDIVTGIFPENELEKISGLNAIRPARNDFEIFDGAATEQNFFLDCDYETFSRLCGANNIEPDGQFIAVERKIFRAAELYKIGRPAIFLPYARRAVKIRGGENFNGKLLSGYKLAWNVRISNAEDFEPTVAPYGDGEIYRYIFSNVEANEYICPAAEDFGKILGVSRDAARERLTIIAREKLSGDFDRIKILRLPNNFVENFKARLGKTIFMNFDRTRQIQKPARLRTERDIEQILFGLSLPESGFSCELASVSFSPAEKILPRYQNDTDYLAQDLAAEQIYYSGRRALPTCLLKFTGAEKFLVDYAAYVLRYLENFYPEYRWAGARL